ncbi:MAG: tail fiber domain-containing protein [Bacteroidota bacterium]
MNKLLLFFCFALLFQRSFSQYVGIGTTTPAFRLDVQNGTINTDSLYRINGSPVLSIMGVGNVFAGNRAGNFNTGFFNSFVGTEAGYSNTSGGLNSAIGYFSLHSNKTGGGNTANGANALFSNVLGNDNTACGALSLNSNGRGGNNTANGFQSLRDNDGGSDNTASGFAALLSNMDGDGNVAVGSNALLSNTNGNSNVAIGKDALFSAAIGNYAVSIGDSSLYNQNSSPVTLANVAVGSKAGFSTSTGFANSFFGSRAGYSNTSGNFNTFIGPEAGNLNVNGSKNTFIGYDAGYSSTSGTENTFIGAGTGGGPNSQSGLTLLGYGSYPLLNNIQNATAIGRLSGVNCSSCLVLGGTTFNDAATKVGINNTTPLTDLHIIQQSDASGDNSRGIRLQRPSGNQWRIYVDGSNQLTFEYNNGGSGRWGWINTVGNFVNGSDARSKKDIQPLDEGILQKVLRLQPKKYLFKQQDNDENYSYGFLAQEVQQVFPEFISERHGGYLGISYSSFGVVAIKAIQEQQQQIAALQKENSQIKNQYAIIMQRLEALENNK